MSHDQLKAMAAAVATELHGTMTPELRKKFIDVRAELFQRGLYDPVLVRFDSATVPHATQEEIAAQLGTIAESLPAS
ncbi:MAG: hypothetical protein DMF56_26410 [Acidobacteria bacterium]|nr:MAG: hypothetical protein DMF56_26410 [Acidobacteriota bacterium]